MWLQNTLYFSQQRNELAQIAYKATYVKKRCFGQKAICQTINKNISRPGNEKTSDSFSV